MFSFTIELAGVPVAVKAQYERCFTYCKDYLTDKQPEYHISICESDFELERSMSASKNPSLGMLEWLAVYRKACTLLAEKNVVLIHGSCVMVDGNAYLFCAPSGTGKSTHTALWMNYLGNRAVMINDDKPLVRIFKNESLADNSKPYTALIYGTPWNGKHNLGTNTCAPLRNICFIERNENNVINRVSNKNALPLLLRYTFRPNDPAATLHILDTTAKIVDFSAFWSLGCNISQEAAITSYTAMSGALNE